MPVQTPQWSEFLSCPVCQNEFETKGRVPVSLICGHTVCKTCLQSLQRNQCPFDQNPIGLELNKLPANTALLQLIGNGDVPREYRSIPEVPSKDKPQYSSSIKYLEDLALFLKPSQSSQLSRPMQRKLITLVTSQLLQEDGRARGVRAARSLGERSVTELILQHQNPQQLSANLWAAVRARGCQFLGPAMQEEVLKLVLLALEEGSALSRKVLVMFVVQRLEPHFPQASKTSIGHVVQLLYRASCFKVTKREGDSSLMQLKEEFRTYDNLRREHDTQIVQIATEGGLRIAPDQWSSLLYGDSAHKSHMQSIIDKLQTPQSFGQSVQELVIALQRTGDPGRLSCLRPHLDILTGIDPSTDSEVPAWDSVVDALKAAHTVVSGLVSFCNMTGAKKTGETYNGHLTRYKTSMCRDLSHHGSCPRGQNCTFAHTQSELEFHRNGVKNRSQAGEDSRSSSAVRDSVVGQGMLSSGQRQHQHSSAGTEAFPAGGPRQTLPPSIQGQMLQRQHRPQPTQPRAEEYIRSERREQNLASFIQQSSQPPAPASEVKKKEVPVTTALTQHRQVSSARTQQVPVIQQVQPIPAIPVQQQPGFVQEHPHIPSLPAAPAQQQIPQITPIVDANGSPVIDMNTGQPLVAAHPPILPPPVQMAAAEGSILPGVQPNQVQIANIQVAQGNNLGMTTFIMPPAPQPLIPLTQDMASRRFSHDISPELATKSLSALKDRKEEIISELGDIVGPTAAKAIGDITHKQAANQKFPINPEQSFCPSSTVEKSTGLYGIWTSRPIATISSLKLGSEEPVNNTKSVATIVSEKVKEDMCDEDELRPLPEGICVSRFGPISRKQVKSEVPSTAEPWSVTASNTGDTTPTPSMIQPLASACALPENVLQVADQNLIFQYNPGYYNDLPIEGMDSISMQHLVNPPRLPISPMPNPREQQCKVNSQNYSMFVESNRIHKELQDLQRRISCLSVAENSAQMALKRDRLAFELRMVEGGIQDRHKEMNQDVCTDKVHSRGSAW